MKIEASMGEVLAKCSNVAWRDAIVLSTLNYQDKVVTAEVIDQGIPRPGKQMLRY